MDDRRINMPRTALAVGSGFLLTASFPQFGHGLFAWFALVPLMIALNGLSTFDGFRLGFLTGLVHYGGLLYWFVPFLKTYGPFSVMLSVAVLFVLCAYMALFPGLFGALFGRLGRSAVSCVLLSPVIWVSLEYVRSVLFTGFPWELLGHSQYDALHIIQVSDILGVLGVSFLIVLSNAICFLWWLFFAKRRCLDQHVTKRQIRWSTAFFGVLFTGAWVYGAWQIQALDERIARSPEKRIAVVQGNIDQTLKWDAAHQQTTVNTYLELSSTQQKEKPDLIVWPETAMPFYLFHQGPLTNTVIGGIRQAETDFIVSSPAFSQKAARVEYFNRAFLILADGSVPDTYDKAHLVPFGEYVPFKNWLPFLGKMVEQVGDFSSGRVGDTLEWRQHRLGILICYELIFPYLSRAAVRNGADVLVNLTNDAWYGRSSAPYQHFSMAVFRAVENRRTLVRAANTGISGFIDPVGRILMETPIFTEASLTMNVPLLNMVTPYSRWGDVFAWGCLLLVLGMMIRRFRIKQIL